MNIFFKLFLTLNILIFSISVKAQMSLTNTLALADSLQLYANYEEALQYYQTSLQAFEQQQDWVNYVKTANKLAQNLAYQGQFDASTQFIEQILQTQTFVLEQEILLEADLYNTLGFNYLNKGQNQEALKFFEKALKAYQAQQGAMQRSETALCFSNLGITYWNAGNITQALTFHEQALQIRKGIFGEIHPEVAASYNDIGLIYSVKSPEFADKYYQEAFMIYKNIYGEKHPKIAIIFNNLGTLHSNQQEYTTAQRYFERSIEIWEQIYPNGHPNTAFVYSSLGQIALKEGFFEQAIEYQTQALSIYQQYYGEKHPEIANVYNAIGAIYLKENDFETALTNFQKAIIANSINFNAENWQENPPLQDYYQAEVLLVSLMLKAEALEGRYLQKTLSFKELDFALNTLEQCDQLLSQMRQIRNNPNDKIALGQLGSEVYEDAIRIALTLAEVSLKTKKYYAKAFYFSEKNKAAVLLEAISETQAKSFAGIPDELLAEEKQLTEKIAFLERALAEKPEASLENAFRTQLLEKQQEYATFIQNLEQEYPQYFELKYSVKIADVPAIQTKIDKKTLLISYFIASQSKTLYIFQISKKNFKIFDIPLADKLTGNINALRNAIRYESSKTFEKAAFFLYENLFPKKIATKFKKIIIIPEGELNAIPFEVLLTRENKNKVPENEWNFLLKTHAISYAYAATLLLQTLENEEVMLSTENIALFAPVSFEENENAMFLSELPATKNEVLQIANLFSSQPQVFLEQEARETQVKSANLRDFQYLHFATHGVVDEQSPERSQIVLVQDSLAQEDGALFFGEIYNLRLDASLVTLSACETGLGKLLKGEGLVGLSRALLYAGADNLLVSLWAVADQSTSELMVYFYQKLLETQDKSLALQQAKLQWLTSHGTQEEDRLNVYFWAPFILIGR